MDFLYALLGLLPRYSREPSSPAGLAQPMEYISYLTLLVNRGVRPMRPTGGTGESIRGGVCGLGFIGPVHVGVFRRIQHVTVNAVSSTEPGRAEVIAARFTIPRIYTNHEDLFADHAIASVQLCATY